MISVLARRLVRVAITLLAIVTAVFLAVRLVPGNPALILLGDYPATPELIAALEEQMGLDQPIWVQYVRFLGQVAQGDLGYSFRSRVPTMELIGARYMFTVHLAVAGFLLAVAVGVVTGVFAARFHGTRWDLAIMAVNNIWISTPFFWLGLLLLLFLSVQLDLFPLTGAGDADDPLDLLHHLVVPALAVGLRAAAIISRMTRSAVLEILGEDYVRTAWAKGLAARPVYTRHVLRNALAPIISIAAVELITLLGGSMIVEVVFSRPGVGQLFIQAALARDYPTIQACVLVFGLTVTLVNFAADLAYNATDPRIRAA